MLGDWNAATHEIESTGWHAAIRAVLVKPAKVVLTCAGGKGRAIDFAAVSGAVGEVAGRTRDCLHTCFSDLRGSIRFFQNAS